MLHSKPVLLLFLPIVLFGMAFSSRRGNCPGASTYKCTAYGYYEVKQCEENAAECDCIDPNEGSVKTQVSKDENCPQCLLDNAEEYERFAQGVADTNRWTCDSEGYYSSEPQCIWTGYCYCYSKDGEIKKQYTPETPREDINCDGDGDNDDDDK